MNRMTAVIITAVSTLLCGIPALGLTCLGSYMVISTRVPALMEASESPLEVTLWTGIILALFGLGTLALIGGVGILLMRASQADAERDKGILPLP